MVRIGHLQLGDFPLLLAPMEDVSDPPFRVLCKRHGADLMFTEFISSEGLIRHAEKSVRKLDLYDEERPIGIQIFGGNIEVMADCVEIIEAANPDLIDINYGCPVKAVTCKGAGAAILKDVPKMVEMTARIVRRSRLPVTVKTRLGWDASSINIMEVAERLQDVGIAALTIHGRTREQMYKGKANWDLIGEVKNNPRIRIPIFLNGDVTTPQQALYIRQRYGVDGIMIGRAAIGNPWIFNQIKHFLATGTELPPPSVAERVEAVRMHLRRSLEWKGERLGLLEMRRHYGNYFRDLPGIKAFRDQLVRLDTPQAVFSVLEQIENHYSQHQPFQTTSPSAALIPVGI
ncbi:MAG: tRNA dihydrouridine synthase DusB [Chitinophagales bacterium]|nr:tRNA dihydrouridine synthase DusB [Chitinophagales bacterium]MDW8427172.1 tRNA dihydrouridine synthase DusB [Chitinophagales bacterium]